MSKGLIIDGKPEAECSLTEKFDFFTQRFTQGLSSVSAPQDGFATANAAHDELIQILKPHQVASVERQCMGRRSWEAYCFARRPGVFVGWWRRTGGE